jgi:hypothetical protein
MDKVIHHYGDASSFLSLTRLSRQAFSLLFDAIFLDNQEPKKAGRPLRTDPAAQLCLYLFFYWEYYGWHLIGQSIGFPSMSTRNALIWCLCSLYSHLMHVTEGGAECMELNIKREAVLKDLSCQPTINARELKGAINQF